MPLKQQNSFCGVVLKQGNVSDIKATNFTKVTGNFYVQSEKDLLFDGYIPGISSFNHDNISFYSGSWAVCEFKEDAIKLSRDRVGTRSIYYINTNSFFAFANNLKSLFTIPFVKFEISHKGAFDFFFNTKTSELVHDVQELRPGQILQFDLASNLLDILTFYNYEADSSVKNEDQIIAELQSALQDCIKETIADSSGLASLLSGGLDSSVIAAVANGIGSIPYISGVSNREGIDETPYAQEIVRQLGIKEWHQVVSKNIDQEIENLHSAMELPTTSLGSFLQYDIMRFCSYKGITDVFDGTGADALFAGHNFYQAFYWNELLRKGKISKFLTAGASAQLGVFWPKYYAKNMLKYYYLPRFSIQSQLKFAYRNNPLLGALNPDFVENQKKQLGLRPETDLKTLNGRLKYDFFNGGVTELLRFPDRMGKAFGVMNHSIYAMYPSIYELALSISSDNKIALGYQKYILRKAYEKQLPLKILSRKDKVGLAAPNNFWMREYKDLFLSYIDDSMADFYQVEKMRDLISSSIDLSGDVENYKVFKFISFAVWSKVMRK